MIRINKDSKDSAKAAADDLGKMLGIKKGDAEVGVILGTGWGSVLTFDREEVPLRNVEGFGRLSEGPKGHARTISICKISGKNVLPEAIVASLYPDVKVLAVAFVTNNAVEPHSHETNLERARKRSTELGEFITRVVANLP